jgi:hypothetical protein
MHDQPFDAESDFTRKHVQRLLSDYTIAYSRGDHGNEYFISSKQTQKRISYALKLIYYSPENRLHVSKFCPMLFRQPDSKNLSAACFYLLIHHFASNYPTDGIRGISLKTDQRTFEKFYARLKEFDFYIYKEGLGDTVEIHSNYTPRPADTSMIEERL